MSDVPPEDDPPEDEIHDLREAAKRGKEARSEADALKREVAFLKAGVDLDSKLGQMFARSYDGDLDVDKVKAEWSELAPAPVQETEPTPDPVEQRQTRERQSLAADAADPAKVPDIDPRRAGIAEFHRLRDEGYTSEEAATQYFDKLLTAAVAGDRRVIWDARAEAEFKGRA